MSRDVEAALVQKFESEAKCERIKRDVVDDTILFANFFLCQDYGNREQMFFRIAVVLMSMHIPETQAGISLSGEFAALTE